MFPSFDVMRISLSPLSGSSTSEGIGDAVNTLRAELEASSHHTERALLHYELGLLYEQVRDDHSAAKELLLAVNGDPSLREPLERLIALMERRRSYVNLGKLLDRLGRVAQSPDESVRAQLARGDYLVDQRSDLVTALAAYEQAAQLLPDSGLVWLSLHYLAARQSDAKLVESALTRRIQLAHDRGYRDGLRLQLARFQALRGRQDLARATLEAASSPHSPVLYQALLQLEQLVKPEDHVTQAGLLDQQAAVLVRGLENADHAHARGVPPSHVSVSRLIDVTLRAVMNLEAAGKETRAIDALERAFPCAPTNRLLVRALRRVNAASEHEADDRLVEFARSVEAGAPEELDASLWLDQALRAPQHGDLIAFGYALSNAIGHSPNSVVARALELETYWPNQRFAELGNAYEALVTQLPDQNSQVHAHLLAAIARTLGGEPKDRVLAALNAAEAKGATKLWHWHVTLSHLHGNAEWARATIERQLGADGPHAITARLEAVYQASRNDDTTTLSAHLDALVRSPDAQRIGLLLRATLPATATTANARIEALHALSTLTDGDTRLGLQRWVAQQHREQGNLGTACTELLALHEAQPSDTTTTLQLAPLLVEQDDPESAVDALNRTAEANASHDIKQQFHTHAGIIAYRAKAVDAAILAFTQASNASDSESHDGSSSGCSTTLGWALRASSPNDPATRRSLLALSTAADEHRGVQALERFALEIGFGNQKSSATEALVESDDQSLDDVTAAVQLARALWTEYPENQAAVHELEAQSTLGKELVAATAYYSQRADLVATTDTWLAAAEEWANFGSLPAALEWLGAALNAADAASEVKARHAIARNLEGQVRDYVMAEALLVEHFASLKPETSNLDGTPAKLANAELANPMSPPDKRASALSELLDVFDAGETSEHNTTLRLMAAYNHLATTDFEAAKTMFEAILDQEPDDLAAWEGLLECARGIGVVQDEAKALMRIGAVHGDVGKAAEAFRQAAALFLDSLEQPDLGYHCLRQAVERDVAETKSFTRLLKYAKTQQDHAHVIALTSSRLLVAESAKELIKLHWERARAYHAVSKLEKALADLGNVSLLDPSHVGAKALAGTIYIAQEDYRRAAAELSELALIPNADAEQRRLGAITAIDLYESKLDDMDAALELFNQIAEENLDLLPVAERLVAACTKAKRWEETLVLSNYLSSNLPTAKGRAEAARLQLAVYRDELQKPERALSSVQTLLEESPGDAEAVDTLLDGVFGQDARREVLRNHLSSIVEATARADDADSLVRLARVADELDDLELRLVTLGALVRHEGPESETLRELDQLLGHTTGLPQPLTDTALLSHIVNDEEQGALIEILRLIAPHLPDVFGPTVSSLGLGRKERRAAQETRHLRAHVTAWANAMDLKDYEFYLTSHSPESIAAVAAPKEPAIIMGGADRVLTPFERGRLASSIVGLVRGTYACIEYPADKVAALLCAACRVGQAELPGADPALTTELERQLSRELPRRIRKELEPLAKQAVQQGIAPLDAVRAATATLDRVAVLASGDLTQTLVTREALADGVAALDSELQARLQKQTEFCLSTTYLNLRLQLGLSAK